MGYHFAKSQAWYDLVQLLEFARSSTAELNDQQMMIDSQFLNNLLVSYAGIVFNLLPRTVQDRSRG